MTILTLGSRGDVQPFVAFGLGLQRAGHDIQLATHPKFEPLVTASGLRFARLAEGRLSRGTETTEGRLWAQRGSRWLPPWVGFVRDARSVARQRLADAVSASWSADVVVASNLATVLGWQVAEHRGVPLVRAYLNAPPRISPRVAGALRQTAWLAARPWLNAVRKDVLPADPLPRREPVARLDQRHLPVLYAVSPAVFPRPDAWSYWVHVTGYWFLDDAVDPKPPQGLVDFLDAGPPPVCVSFGSTMVDRDPARLAAIVVEALRRTGRRGIIVRGPNGFRVGTFPDDVHAVDAVSYAWLFPRCAAIVHHASASTTAEALRAGVPSVTVPHMTDQFAWARRLSELGVSATPVPRRKLSVERLAEGIRVAVANDIREATATLAARIRREDGVGRAVEIFERALDAPPGAWHRRADIAGRGAAPP